MYHRITVHVPVLVRVPEYLSTSTSTITLELTSTSTVRVPEIQYSSTASTSTEYEYPSPEISVKLQKTLTYCKNSSYHMLDYFETTNIEMNMTKPWQKVFSSNL